MTARDQLTELHYAYYRRTYPAVPESAIPKPDYTDSTTNGLTRMILDYFKFTGGLAERINVTGRRVKAKSGKEIWIPTAGVRGSSDISVTYRGRSLKIEVKCKRTRDRMRPEQLRYAARVKAAGGEYVAVGTFGEFLTWITTGCQ